MKQIPSNSINYYVAKDVKKHLSIIVGYCVTILMVTFLFAPQINAKDLSGIRFKENMWDGQILRILIEGPNYLNSDLEFDVQDPPRNDSAIVQNELKILEEYRRTKRSVQTIQLIKQEARKMPFVDMFLTHHLLSKNIKKAAYHSLAMADKECRYFVVKYKKRFARPRPNQLNPDLKLVVPNPGHAAYPSGHATQSMLMALILAEIDPKQRDAYLNYARSMALRREIAGVHYPSDSAAGQKLAGKILVSLKQIPAFQTELSESKALFRTHP